MEIYLIGLAVALVGGLLMSRLTRLLHLPAVTAYLVAGLLLGPFFLGNLQAASLPDSIRRSFWGFAENPQRMTKQPTGWVRRR